MQSSPYVNKDYLLSRFPILSYFSFPTSSPCYTNLDYIYSSWSALDISYKTGFNNLFSAEKTDIFSSNPSYFLYSLLYLFLQHKYLSKTLGCKTNSYHSCCGKWKYCPFCSQNKYRDLSTRLVWNPSKTYQFLTLGTLHDVDSFLTCPTVWKDQTTLLDEFLQDSDGYLLSREVSWNSLTSFFPHTHAIVCTDNFPLSSEITSSYNLDCRPITNQPDFLRCLRYCVKPHLLPYDYNRFWSEEPQYNLLYKNAAEELVYATSNVRLLTTKGEFHGNTKT